MHGLVVLPIIRIRSIIHADLEVLPARKEEAAIFRKLTRITSRIQIHNQVRLASWNEILRRERIQCSNSAALLNAHLAIEHPPRKLSSLPHAGLAKRQSASGMIASIVGPKSPRLHQLLALVRWNLRIPVSFEPPSTSSRPSYAVAGVNAFIILAIVGVFFLAVIAEFNVPHAATLRACSRATTAEL